MKNQDDTAQLLLSHPLKQFMESRYGVKFKGTMCRCPMPNHNDSQPSCKVYQNQKTGVDNFHCHGCGARGDLVELVHLVEGKDKKEVFNELRGKPRVVQLPAKVAPPQLPVPVWDVFPEDFAYPGRGSRISYIKSDGKTKGTWPTPVSRIHRYYTEDGQHVVGIVMRCEPKDAPKQMMPFRLLGDQLHNAGWPNARPWYGVEKRIGRTGLPIVIVGGEKKADDGNALFDGQYVFMCWQGGDKAIAHVDFSQFKDREVLVWPDADASGREMGEKAVEALKAAGAQVITLVKPEEDRPAGWDLSDFLLIEQDKSIINQWIRDHSVVVREPAKVVNPTKNYLPANIQWNTTDKGVIASTDETNLVWQLTYDPKFKDRISWDTFDREIRLDGSIATAMDIRNLAAEINLTWPFLRPRHDKLAKLVSDIAVARQVSQMAGELMTLSEKWDQEPRLWSMLTTYAETEDSQWASIAGLRWMVGAAGRILSPGLQHDTVLVLEGHQGFGKTAFFRRLSQVGGRDLYADMISSGMGRDKDDMIKMAGKAIIEMGELAAMRRSDAETFKHYITTTKDIYRRPYQTQAETFPRSCVFCGTTNEGVGYLADPTGNRRIWPVKVLRKIDRTKLTDEVLEQLWGEAASLFLAGEPNYLSASEEEIHAQIIQPREETDSWEEILRNLIENVPARDPIPAQHLFHALGKELGKDQSRQDKIRLSAVMKKFGREERRGNVPGDRSKAYRVDARTLRGGEE